MTIYYCINETLDMLDAMGDRTGLKTMIPVSTTPPECGGHKEDAFALSSSPKLLDLRKNEAPDLLARVLEDVPLYNINLELILDEALAERHKNTQVETAMGRAFGSQPMPNALKQSHAGHDDISGGLLHPMLGHSDRVELCRIYIEFLKALGRKHEHYDFEKNILGKHTERFTEYYDGFISIYDGKVRAEILLAFGHRLDHDPAKPMESYTESGQKRAGKMRIEEERELIWAWLEADHYQMRRCHDLDRIFHVEGLPKVPNWVRADIFSLLEREAMKQFFAESLMRKDPTLPHLANTPALQKAIQDNARGHVDEAIQQLMSQTLSPGTAYAGAAHRFAEQAQKRALEGKRAALH
ncbi:MAG: hypothetical protein H6867_01055 [Rhodospirillales bacterium]|nr:hypothetical protein [Rhodospirillales bacterium]MCB9997306.1 hypothetical protein [Rhodospirillales bacterium]